jgi:hypothetical protein
MVKVLPAVPSFEAATNGSAAAAPVQAAHSLHELFASKDTDAIFHWAKQNKGSKKQEELRQEFKLVRAKPNTLGHAWLKLLTDVLEQLKSKVSKREDWVSEVRLQLQWLCASCEDSKQLSKASRLLVRLTELSWISADSVKAWAAETGSDRLQDKLLQRLQQQEEEVLRERRERAYSPAAYSDTSPAYSPTSYSPSYSPGIRSPIDDYAAMSDVPVAYSPPDPSAVAAAAAAYAADYGDLEMYDVDAPVDDDEPIVAGPEIDGMNMDVDIAPLSMDLDIAIDKHQLLKLDACALIRHVGQACGYGAAAMAVSFSWFHRVHVSTAVIAVCHCYSWYLHRYYNCCTMLTVTADCYHCCYYCCYY